MKTKPLVSPHARRALRLARKLDRLSDQVAALMGDIALDGDADGVLETQTVRAVDEAAEKVWEVVKFQLRAGCDAPVKCRLVLV